MGCVTHVYSLFESETLTHSESLRGKEFLRDFVPCISFPFDAFLRLSLESSKSRFQVNGNPFLLNSMEYKLDELVLYSDKGNILFNLSISYNLAPIAQAQVILPNKVSSC
jgi:hypothetical protein